MTYNWITALELTIIEFKISQCNTTGRIANLRLVLLVFALSVIVLFLSSCTLTVHPDGSRTYGVDAATAIQILDAK